MIPANSTTPAKARLLTSGLPGPRQGRAAHRAPFAPVIGGFEPAKDLLGVRHQEDQEKAREQAGRQAPGQGRLRRGQVKAVEGRHALPDRHGLADRVGPEHDVGVDHRCQGDQVGHCDLHPAGLRQGAAQLLQRAPALLAQLHPGFVGADIDRVHHAEGEEGPAGAMPGADGDEGDQRRDEHANRERRPTCAGPRLAAKRFSGNERGWKMYATMKRCSVMCQRRQ